MKTKALWSLVLATLLWAGCYSDNPEEEPTQNPLWGTWIAEQVDGKELLTNEHIVHIFYASAWNDRHTLAGPYTSEKGTEWVENDGRYQMKENNTLQIDGTDPAGKSYSIQAGYSFKDKLLHFQIDKFLVDGKERADYIHSYVMRKATDDMRSGVIGIWEGGSTTPGMIGKYDAYWEYKNDGSYIYRYFDEEKQEVVVKEDNDGRFFVYGNLLVSNYNNDLQQGSTGRECENWIISTLNATQMEWIGYRPDNKTITFAMQRK